MIVNINPVIKEELQYIVIPVTNGRTKGFPTIFTYSMSKFMN